MTKRFSITVSENEKVPAILDTPKDAIAILVLAHGAGGGMSHPWMSSLAATLNAQKIATLRFQFPYMEKKSKRPDRPNVAIDTIVAAVNAASKKCPRLPIFAGGKSFGGRMTTTAASSGKLKDVQGILCFGFPLHPPKAPSIERALHLKKLDIPTLWIQGTRDDLADMRLINKVVKTHQRHIKLHVIEGANHSFEILKSSGRIPEDVMEEIAMAAKSFCQPLSAVKKQSKTSNKLLF